MRLHVAVSVVLLSLVALPAGASDSPPPLAPGRVAGLEGSLLLLPAGWDEWREAELNSALAPGDWLRSSHDATASLELSPSLMARLAPRSELRIDRQDGVLVLELMDGSMVVCSGETGEELSVVTPHGAAWLQPGGFYRVDATPRRTTIVVSAGLSEVELNGRVRSVRPGRLAELSSGASKPRVRSASGRGWDDFDRDSQDACARILDRDGELDLVGSRELDRHGEWVFISGMRYWRPYSVSSHWRPFGDGCFRWHPSWGWYFVPRTSWGWVTHHHGWWAWIEPWGWVWYPDTWWHPHRVRFRIVDRHVYWHPRERVWDHDRHDRDDRRYRDDRHDRDEDRARRPDHGWSRAPVEEFGARPIVRARPPLGRGNLPRLSLPDDGGSPPPTRLELPPLPPRGREPAPASRRPLAVRPPTARIPRPAPGLDSEREPSRRPSGDLRPSVPSRPELPGRVREPAPVVRPSVPTRPELPERAREPAPIVRPPVRPSLPPPRLKPRPSTQEQRERLQRPLPSTRVPSRPEPDRPERVREPARPERVVVPRPVVKPKETPKPVVRQPTRRVEPPKPERVKEPAKEAPKPVVRRPVRRRNPPRPAPVPPPKEKEEADGEDDGKSTRR